jgi:phage-related protein
VVALMIPILFNGTETEFTSNGVCRLIDCVSCTVTEERNGIFECEFEYPVTGRHYDLIQEGMTIYATHDETGVPEPFDIY